MDSRIVEVARAGQRLAAVWRSSKPATGRQAVKKAWPDVAGLIDGVDAALADAVQLDRPHEVRCQGWFRHRPSCLLPHQSVRAYLACSWSELMALSGVMARHSCCEPTPGAPCMWRGPVHAFSVLDQVRWTCPRCWSSQRLHETVAR